MVPSTYVPIKKIRITHATGFEHEVEGLDIVQYKNIYEVIISSNLTCVFLICVGIIIDVIHIHTILSLIPLVNMITNKSITVEMHAAPGSG
jgi:hypothetical protein